MWHTFPISQRVLRQCASWVIADTSCNNKAWSVLRLHLNSVMQTFLHFKTHIHTLEREQLNGNLADERRLGVNCFSPYRIKLQNSRSIFSSVLRSYKSYNHVSGIILRLHHFGSFFVATCCVHRFRAWFLWVNNRVAKLLLKVCC
jgi:hypothetical protein